MFDTAGVLVKRLIATGGKLNAPWGMAMAPADFGKFSNALLVANFGDGMINAFDPATGNPLGTLYRPSGSNDHDRRALGHRLRQRPRLAADQHLVLHRRTVG